MNLFRTCLKGRCPQKTNLPRQRPRPAALELEPLEDRLAPVVGNTVVPAPVAPGGPYDGVVLLNRLNGAGAVQSRGSGSLIADGNGHYILTVAHNNAAAGRAQVTFNLQRDGTAVPNVIPVPANPGGPGGAANQFVINHGGYVAGGNNPFLSRNDIALWKLVDPQNQRPDRLLVAPFGAQQYQLYTQRDEATRADRQVTIVGYGRTGVGATGDQGAASGGTKRMGQNTIDTLATTLRSQVALVQFAGPGNFRLRWRGAAQTTAPLTAASPAATVLAALNSIPFGGGTPLSGNVSVQAAAGTPGMWWVTFTNGLGLQRINNTWLAATNGAAVNTVIQGGSATDLPGLNNTKLIADFDSGQPQNDAMGLLYGIGQRGVAAVNEVQSVSLSGAPTGGTFRLAFQQAAALNPQPAALVTPALQWNASANDVLVALQNLTDAAGARPLNGNVRVTGGPAPGTPITITFINALAGVDVIQLSVRNAALTGGNNPRVTVATPTQGSNEVGTAAGDSGGPIFLGNRIAGIVQGGGNPAVAGQGLPPLVGPSDTTFGETEVWGRVSSYAVNNPGGGSDGFIPTSIAATANYNLVLDMQTQVAGAARNAAGNWDDLTITASRGGPNNANLVITITDQTDPTFSGVYYSAPAANILTLTLRGAAGDETFVVQGNLNLGPTGNGLIEVDGRGGNNELEVHDEARTTNNLRYSVDGGSVRVMNGERTSVLLAVDYSRINAGLEVCGGSAYSQWDVSSTPACPTTLNAGTGPNDMRVLGTRGPLTINGQGGIDTVAVGNGRVQNIQGDIDVTNTGGLTSLGIDDSAGAAGRNNVILTAFSLSGLAPALISWTPVNINNLNISGGSGGNTFTVRTTPLGVSAAQVTINTGTGNDRVNVLATQRRLTVNGQDGRDQVLIGNQGNAQGIRGQVSVTNANGLTDLTVDNSADPSPRNATLGAFGLFGLCPGDITWVETGLRSLVINGSTVNAGGVGNTFMVTSTPRLNAVRRFKTVLNTGGGSVGDTVTVRSVTRSELVINGQGGRDNVTIGFAGSVQLINGPVTVTNDRSRTALTIDDSANPAARPNVTLTATSLTGLAPEVFETIAVSISWVQQDLSSLTVKGGTGGNTFNVNNTPRNNFPVTTTLLTGGGNDTVNVRAANGPLTVNGQAGDDRDRFFNFRDSATIDGGPGNDTVEAAQGTLSTSQVPFTDVENLEVTGASTLAVDADVSTGKALVKEGTLDLRGGIPNVSDRVELQALGVLTGAGTINGSLLNGGQVRPAGDGAVGRITVRDDYAQALTGRLNLDLRRPEPGTQSDNLEVGHRVGLSGTLNLNALGGFTGNSFELVTNRGPDDVNGTFAGLPEGAIVTVAGRRFRITYKGGDGNDVVLYLGDRAVATTTTVGFSLNPSVYGQSVQFTATVTPVAPGGGTPTGAVQFLVDGVNFGPSVPLTAGVAGSDSLTNLPAGSHLITAVYGGDTIFLASTGTGTQVVTPAPLTITADNKGKVYGASLPALTASYGGFVNGDTSASLTTPPTLSTTATASSAVGNYPITASGAVAANYTIRYVAGSLTVNPAGTVTGVGASSSTSVFGEPIFFAASVLPLAPGAGTPTGTVAFKRLFPDGSSVTFGTAALDATGTATLVMDHFVPATATVFAVYLGDGNFSGSSSTTITHVINKAGTTLAVSSSTPVSVAGQQVNFTSTLGVVPPGSIATAPTGTITFYDTFNGSTVVTSVLTVGGPPGTSPAFTAAGTHTITAVYSGDDNFEGSTSAPLTLIVTPGEATHLRIVPAQSTVFPGVPFAMTVTALDDYGNVATGYRGTVHFTSSDPLAALPPDGAFTAADNGVRTFSGFTLVSPGDQSFTVADTLTSTITGTIFFRFLPG